MISAEHCRPHQTQQATLSLGLVIIMLAGVALANDLDDRSKYKKAFRDTVRNDLESQWRSPLSNENTWRESEGSGNRVTPAFDNYDMDDIGKFQDSQSFDSDLQKRNPTLFGLKLKF